MSTSDKPAFHIPSDPWISLRAHTDARIALGRVGAGLPTNASLDFKLAHAHARDAIYSTLDNAALTTALETLGLSVLSLQSQVQTRQEYLQRPDLGRRLNAASRKKIETLLPGTADVSIVFADGLSAEAVNLHAVHVLAQLLPALAAAGLSTAPVVLADQARVAIADDIGSLLKAELSLIFIGERPGLTSPHSLGAYLTYHPKPGLTDESRNCISNIRPEGLVYADAAQKIFYLVAESLRRKLSGVMLKGEGGLLAGEK
ncbi:ethanolamine ammonia-lyase subunit EutC [Chryseolinea lacunae]|uniref:Ethanolamine ammonia-lyase small subunit n=1 Tax=Chryseolinea lacunae TaxID=2801331 RepID=A0ABS1KS60_9BACT|nr:ethanolamine ammonia-lyase subunit EutC [Chryseolinea lacunae]MBL0742062.1 ethanolamine ammonia-lyase subunit EutC [Chryseolinea lacunae]